VVFIVVEIFAQFRMVVNRLKRKVNGMVEYWNGGVANQVNVNVR
jgi:hypothetical protein